MVDLCKHPLELPGKLEQRCFPEVLSPMNEMYLMAGGNLSKSDYQKSVKSKMAANDSTRKLL